LAASLRTRVAVTDDGLETFQVDDDYFKRLREKLASAMTAMHTD
tara:strand:- start:321 stop:452 length:132 start_codon:yes stop_codon:yes gene_type:complete